MKRIIYFIIALGFVMVAKGQPDLMLNQSMVVNPNNLHIGQYDTISFYIENFGSSNATPCHIGIYIGPTTDMFDAQLMGEISFGQLASGHTSDNIKYVLSIPYNLNPGSAHIFVVLNDLDEISGEDRGNNENVSNAITLTSAWAEQHIPYPMIFIHGFMGSGISTWNTMISSLNKYYGWSYGGNMDFCLNYDMDKTISDVTSSNTDYHDFTGDANHILNPNPCDFYTINFDVDYAGNEYTGGVNSSLSESNQAGIVKQGIAVRDAIEHVRQVTGRDKVILVCHSMGGLAAREYIQNVVGETHVAKLCTIGTPHGGTDIIALPMITTFGYDARSEAIRDLRTGYTYSYNYPFLELFPDDNAPGVYLFGGYEDLTYMRDEINGDEFYNADVNCNGHPSNSNSSIDQIIGLNEKSISSDLTYSCIIGKGIYGDDGVVSLESQSLNNYYPYIADTFHAVEPATDLNPFWHTEETDQVQQIMRGLDEPKDFNNSNHPYQISTGILYNGLITQKSYNLTDIDKDYYSINISSTGNLRVQIFNIPSLIFSISIYNSSHSSVFNKNCNLKSWVDTTIAISSGTYYVVISGVPSEDTWRAPYAYKFDFSQSTTYCNGTTNLTLSTGTFDDGSGSSNYSNNSDCRWHIHPSGATSITLDFPAFDVADPNDTVFVYDGGLITSPLLLAWTGNTLPTSVTSTGGTMLVRFVSDASVTAPGWTAHYTSVVVPTFCNGQTNLTAPSGSFSDGSGNLDYGDNADCSWLISPPGAISITLTFQDFITEPANDVVNVYDGSDNTATLLGSFSGSSIPTSLTSSVGAMYVEFISNSSITTTGWDASYSSNIPNNNFYPVNIQKYEYWFDSDYGNAVTGLANGQRIFTLNSNIHTSGLSVGLHTYHIHFIDESGNWSSVVSQFFNKLPASLGGTRNVVAYEYWFDNDYSGRVNQNVGPQAVYDLNNVLSTIPLSVGLHTYHIHFLDDAGTWSSVVSQFFNKLPSSNGSTRNVVAYEYWFDNNYAGSVNQTVGPQAVYDLNNVLSTTPLSVGLHTYHIHFLDDAGTWSSVVSQFFNKLPVSAGGTRNIVAYEYWFDNNYVSNPQSVGSQPVYLLNTNEACSGLTPGLHTYHIHFLDDAGTWSSVVSQFFTKLGITNSLPNLVTAYSYWFDMNSAGMTTVNLSVPVSPYNLITNIPAQTLSAGQHTVHFQFEDTLHYWSSVITDTFMNFVVPVAAMTTPDTLVCVGSTVHFTNNSVGGNHYLWNFGDTFTSGAFAPTHQYSDTGYYTVTLIVTDSVSGYGDTTIINNMVHVIQQTASITTVGNTTFCQGDSVRLNANTGAGFSYVWKRNNTIINGAINASYTAILAGTYTVVVSNNIGCSATSTGVNVTVNTLPTSNITHTGNLTFCQGGSVQLTANNATSFLWSNGETTQNITVTNSGSFTVTVTDANGCNGVSSSTSVVVNPLPTPTISGTTSFCQGDSTQLTINPAGVSYLWSNGRTTQSIYVLTGGGYTVTLTDVNGCTGISSATNVTVDPLPLPTITGTTSFCQGDSTQLTSNPTGASYLWSNGRTTQSIYVLTGGSYTVTLTDGNGCSGVSSATNVTVDPLPPIPTISSNGNILTSSATSGNQWLLNNVDIPNATNNTDTATTTGCYKVKVTDGNGCTAISSDSICLIVTGMGTLVSNSGIAVFPNPNTGTFTLQINDANSSPLQFKISNAMGQVIYEESVLSYKGLFTKEINLNDVTSGVYFLEIILGEERYYRKVILEK